MDVDQFDVALVAMGIGVILMNIILFIIYMILRRRHTNNMLTRKRNKSDRPLWIGATMVGGAFWIIGSLLAYGCFGWLQMEEPKAPPDSYLCIFVKYGLQYTLGFSIWISSLLYRMVRLWQSSVRFMMRPWRPIMLNLLLVMPWVILAGIAFAYNEMYVDASGLYMQDRAWSLTLASFGAAYFLIYIIFIGLCAKLWGRLGRMQWHIVLIGISFLFLGMDLAGVLAAVEPIRLIPQLTALFVICVVLIHSWIIFLSVLEAPPIPKRKADLSVPAVGLFKADSTGKYFDLLGLDPNIRERVLETERQLRVTVAGKEEAKDGLISRFFRLKQNHVSMGDDELEDTKMDAQERIYWYLPEHTNIMTSARTEKSTLAYDRIKVKSQFHPVDLDRLPPEPEESQNNNAIPIEHIDLVNLEETKRQLRLLYKNYIIK